MSAGADGPGVERVLLGAAAFVVVVAGMKVAGEIIAPIALALVLVVALSPVRDWLVRHRVPGWLATILLILVLYGVLAGFALALVLSVGRLTTLVPQYADEAQEMIAKAEQWLTGLGVTSEQAGAAVSRLDPGTFVDIVSTVVGSLLSIVTDLLFILTLLLFMAVEAAGYPRRIARLAGLRPAVATALRQFAHGTRRYLLVSTAFGLVVAVLDGVALQIMGVPLPFLWALLAFVTNYIPNIGFVIGLVPPALLALLDGWPRTDDRGGRRLLGHQLRAPVDRAAEGGRRQRRPVGDRDVPVAGALGLDPRRARRHPRRAAHAARAGPAGRRLGAHPLGRHHTVRALSRARHSPYTGRSGR